MKTYSYYLLSLLLPFGASYSSLSQAEQNTDLLLQQRDAWSSREHENALIEEEIEKEHFVGSSVSSTRSGVAMPANQLGPALHMAVKQHQWTLAEDLLERYASLAEYDPMLVHYASGALARHERDYERAEHHYLELLELQHHFLPAELELARVWYEDRKSDASLSLFNDIASRLPSDNPRAAGVRQTVDSFVRALEYREQWQGSISVGPTFNDNLNHSSGDSQCLLYLSDGQCFIMRSAPKVKSAYGVDYDVSLNRHFSLSGQHGLQFRSFAYGTQYQDHQEHNEQTLNVALGYSYQAARHQLSVMPLFEFRTLSNRALYASAGLKANWLSNLTSNSAVKLELKGEYLDYRNKMLSYQSDWQWSVFGTYWHQLPEDWLVFGGLDWTLKQNPQSVHEYNIWGARIGVNKRLPSFGTELTLFASQRHRLYGDYNAMLGEQREDREQSYTLMVTLPEIALGIRPLIEVKANYTDSNVAWAYSYRQNQYGIKLEKRF
ncbi:surface lipoprotein assembly modifier [Vibrio nereis]|nr:surface lipoprotein assembly modifier [Vibrio nereis]